MKESRRNFERPSKNGYRFGDFRYEPEHGLLFRQGVEVPLAPRARQVLHCLLERAGSPVTKEELLDVIWKDAHVAETSLSEAVARVREALGDDPQNPLFIQTLHRRGYRFIAPMKPASASRRRPLATAALLVVALLAGWGIARLGERANHPVLFTIEPPHGGSIRLKGQPAFAMSRDGRKLAVTITRGESTRLWLRELHRPEGAFLEGTDGAVAPFFSPDGERIGFFARRKLWTLSLSGRAALEIADAPEPYGGCWLEDDRIAFSAGGRIHAVSASGGEPEAVRVHEAARDYRWPEPLPGGKEILVTVWSGSPETAEIAALDLRSGLERPVASGAYARLVDTDRVAFAQEGRILSRSFTGHAHPVLEGVRTDPFTGAAHFAIGASALVYFPGSDSVVEPSRLQWADRSGLLENLPFDAAAIKTARLARDARSVALTLVGGSGPDIYIWSSEPRGLTRLTADGRSTGGVFHPDGKELAFAKRVGDRFQVFSIPVNGSSEARPLVSGDFDVFPTSWSGDGSLLALDLHRPETGWDVVLVSFDETWNLRAVAESPFQERSPRLSPDGSWVAYQSDETGANEIYVRYLDETGSKARVSSGGGEWPLSGPTARELYYLRGRLLMGVRLGEEPSQPQLLFDAADGFVTDVAADERFLVVAPAETPSTHRPHVVLGWMELESPN